MKKYTLPIEKEISLKLQTLGAEIDSRVYLIDAMFNNHKEDTDSSLFDSIPFKKYLKDLDKIQMEYTKEKNALTKILMKEISKKENIPEENLSFDWNIEDFESGFVTITFK